MKGKPGKNAFELRLSGPDPVSNDVLAQHVGGVGELLDSGVVYAAHLPPDGPCRQEHLVLPVVL